MNFCENTVVMRNSIQFIFSLVIAGLLSLGLGSCSSSQNVVWVYTSTYPEHIQNFEEALKKELPEVKVKWFQSGSEDIQARVALEKQAGDVKADIVMTADIIWFEKMNQMGFWEPYTPKLNYTIPEKFRAQNDEFLTNKFGIMVIGYNKKVLPEENLPKSFKDLTKPEWKDKISSGSPLDSGSNFSLYMNFVYRYGYDFFKELRANNIIASGGNSSTIRRIVSGERPLGMLLLENILKEQMTNPHIGIIYPSDGNILIPQPAGLVKKEKISENVKKVYDFLFSKVGQEINVKYHLHAIDTKMAPPKGTLAFSKLENNSFEFSTQYLKFALKEERQFKERFKEIMLDQ